MENVTDTDILEEFHRPRVFENLVLNPNTDLLLWHAVVDSMHLYLQKINKSVAFFKPGTTQYLGGLGNLGETGDKDLSVLEHILHERKDANISKEYI